MLTQYSDRYDNEIRNMLKQTAYTLNWGEKASATMIALEEGKIIGIGTLDKNEIHPHREYIKIYVKPQFRKKGIGKKLVQQLIHASETKKLQATVQSKDIGTIAFLTSCNFQRVRKCYTPVLRKAKASSSKTKYKDSTTVTFKNANEINQSNLMKLHLRNYKEFHKEINALNENMKIQQWKDIVLKDLNQNQSQLLMIDEEVSAYVLCYDTDDSNEIEIGYIGGKVLQNMKDYHSFFRETIEQLISQFETVSIEADDVDPYAFEVLNFFEYDNTLSLDTYIL